MRWTHCSGPLMGVLKARQEPVSEQTAHTRSQEPEEQDWMGEGYTIPFRDMSSMT
jgi:hypothetical protein